MEQSVGFQAIELRHRSAHDGACKVHRVHETRPFDVGIGAQVQHAVRDGGEVCPHRVAQGMVEIAILQRQLQSAVAHFACVLEWRFGNSRLARYGNAQQHVARSLVEHLDCTRELTSEHGEVEPEVGGCGCFPLQFAVACAVKAKPWHQFSAKHIVGTCRGKRGIRVGINAAFVAYLSPTGTQL